MKTQEEVYLETIAGLEKRLDELKKMKEDVEYNIKLVEDLIKTMPDIYEHN